MYTGYKGFERDLQVYVHLIWLDTCVPPDARRRTPTFQHKNRPPKAGKGSTCELGSQTQLQHFIQQPHPTFRSAFRSTFHPTLYPTFQDLNTLCVLAESHLSVWYSCYAALLWPLLAAAKCGMKFICWPGTVRVRSFMPFVQGSTHIAFIDIIHICFDRHNKLKPCYSKDFYKLQSL